MPVIDGGVEWVGGPDLYWLEADIKADASGASRTKILIRPLQRIFLAQKGTVLVVRYSVHQSNTNGYRQKILAVHMHAPFRDVKGLAARILTSRGPTCQHPRVTKAKNEAAAIDMACALTTVYGCAISVSIDIVRAC